MRSRRRSAPKRGTHAAHLPFALAAAILFAWPSAARAGAWARNAGEAYAKASVSYLKAEEMFDDSGDVRPLFDPARYESSRYTERCSALYVEYGLLEALTVLGSLPLKLAEQNAEGLSAAGGIESETFGLGDLHLGARVPLVRRRWAAAIESDLKIPLRQTVETTSTEPALSSGFTDFGASLCLGAGLSHLSGYGQGSIGYRIRGGRTPEEAYWDLEVGLEPARVLRVRFHYDGVRSERSSSGVVPTMGAPAPSAGGQDFHRIAPTLAAPLGRSNELSITWRRIVDGRSTIRSSEWEIAFSFFGKVVPTDAP